MYKEHIRNLLISTTNLIPVVGGSIGFVLDKYIPTFIEEKRKLFINDIEIGLASKNLRDIEINIKNPKFLSIFTKCINILDKEIDIEKIQSIRNIILNSLTLTEEELNFNEVDLFIRLLDTFTLDQIRILKVIHLDKNLYLNIDTDLYNVLSEYFPNTDKDYIIICVQELISFNLVASKGGINSYRQLQTGQIIDSERIHYLTNIGKRFIDFITTQEIQTPY